MDKDYEDAWKNGEPEAAPVVEPKEDEVAAPAENAVKKAALAESESQAQEFAEAFFAEDQDAEAA